MFSVALLTVADIVQACMAIDATRHIDRLPLLCGTSEKTLKTCMSVTHGLNSFKPSVLNSVTLLVTVLLVPR